MTEDHSSPIEHAADLVVYAPIGFLLEARKLVPSLAERGRQQVQMARMMGRFTVGMGRKEVDRRGTMLREQAETVLADLGLAPARVKPPEPAPPAPAGGEGPLDAPPAGTSQPAAPAPTRPRRSGPTPKTSKTRSGSGTGPKATSGPNKKTTKAAPRAASADGSGAGKSVDPSTLPISGYDSLAASQVIPRLAGLSPDELATVQRYEVQHRGRKTILGRIAQLRAG